jgi:hypothetical protein
VAISRFRPLGPKTPYRRGGDVRCWREGNGAPKAWYIDVADSEREAELAFLKAEIYRADVDLFVRRIDAHDRFSDRG